MNNKKQLILSIFLTLIIVVLIIGVSYAVFQFAGTGKRENVITTGIMSMKYTELSNTISLSGALPTTDATGKTRLNDGEYFDFTISSIIQGNANIDWEIAAEDVTTSSRRFYDAYVKLYLTKLDSNGNEISVMAPKNYEVDEFSNPRTGRPANMMCLATGTMSSSDTTKYRLRMWIDEAYNPQGDGGGLEFSVKINVYGKEGIKVSGSKIKGYDPSIHYADDFHGYDNYVYNMTTVVTKNNNVIPSTALKSWDISEAEDGSAVAYVEDDGTGNNTYKLTIGGQGGVVANEDMSYYFAYFSTITSVDLSAMDTSLVKDMNHMFYFCSNLKDLNVSSFNTINVTNMNQMFENCRSLTNSDLSSFNTTNAEDMGFMFCNCPLWETVDKTKFSGKYVNECMSSE